MSFVMAVPEVLGTAATDLANIGSTICQSGYTASVRPPEDITNAEKSASALAYGYTGSFQTAEYDHLIPLELGGDPNAPADRPAQAASESPNRRSETGSACSVAR